MAWKGDKGNFHVERFHEFFMDIILVNIRLSQNEFVPGYPSNADADGRKLGQWYKFHIAVHPGLNEKPWAATLA